MSYTPINTQMFAAAMAGALAGMSASNRIVVDDSSASYLPVSAAAFAFAQSFDIEWNSATPPTVYQLEAIQQLSEAVWQNRAPTFANNVNTFLYTNYTELAEALKAIIDGGSAYALTQGVTFPPFGTDASSILGVPISSAVATRSWGLFGNGTSLRITKRVKTLSDYGAVGDGVTDDTAAVQAFFDDLTFGDEGFIPNPSVFYLCKKKIKKWAGGSLLSRGVLIKCETTDVMSSGSAFMDNFRFDLGEPDGTGASITGYGNGGSGSNMMTVNLGIYTGSSPTGTYSGGVAGRRVLASEASDWIGEWLTLPFAAGMTAGVAGEWQITSVPSDDTITVQGGAAAADVNLHFRINILGMFDIRCRDITLEGFRYGPVDGKRMACHLQVNASPLINQLPVVNNRYRYCTFLHGTGTTRFPVSIARSIVPELGHPNYSVNGNGIRQIWQPTQTDTIIFEDSNIEHPPSAYAEFGIEHVSTSGQSRDSAWYKGNIYSRCPYANPTRSGVTSSGQMNFWAPVISNSDCGWVLGGGNAHPRFIIDAYGEGIGTFFIERGGALSSELRVLGGGMGYSSTGLNPLGTFIRSTGSGPMIVDTKFSGPDATRIHILLAAGQVAKEQVAKLYLRAQGTTTWTGRCPQLKTATSYEAAGPTRFTGTEQFGLSVDGGAPVTFTCTQANFNAACGIAVDMDWILPWMFFKLVNTQIATAAAWAEPDGHNGYLESRTAVSGTIQITTNTTPYVFASVGPVSGSVRTYVSLDTNGWVDVHPGAGGTVDPVAIDLNFDGDFTVTATDAQVAHNTFHKRYGSAALGGNVLESVVGIAARSTRVAPKNLNGSIDITDAATTGAVAFATNESDANYRVTSLTVTEKTGAPATRSARVAQGTKAVGGFTVALDAAPGVGTAVTVEWMITRG